MTFNPEVKDFLKEKPDVTIIGLYWAGYWRLLVAIMAIYAAVLTIALIVGALK